MYEIEAGYAAGKVWRLLDNEGDLSIKDIQRKLNLSESLLHLAIGWLCREDKIHCYEEEKKGKYVCSKRIPSAFWS